MSEQRKSGTKQMSFAQVEYGAKKKLTRRDIFLAKMETVVPWGRLHDGAPRARQRPASGATGEEMPLRTQNPEAAVTKRPRTLPLNRPAPTTVN